MLQPFPSFNQSEDKNKKKKKQGKDVRLERGKKKTKSSIERVLNVKRQRGDLREMDRYLPIFRER